jgi:hypothetical protein
MGPLLDSVLRMDFVDVSHDGFALGLVDARHALLQTVWVRVARLTQHSIQQRVHHFVPPPAPPPPPRTGTAAVSS